ncbi:hypothetical protein [Brachybacterium tyrofermentans]|uniref:hypothetical protein n=1 Tax=Brachybacterium tyrofermentans TaxID=47848 RepID=UPI00384E359D
MIPDLVRAGHIYTITLGAGTWDEIVALEYRVVYGQVIIQGASTDRSLHRVRAVRCDSVIGYLTVKNLTTTIKIASGASFRFYRCAPMVEVENVKAESDPAVEKGVEGVIGLLADYGSQVLVRDSDFGGKRYGMRSNYLSRIFSHNNTGSGSTFGLGARWGGILSTYGTQPTGDTNLTNSSGGILAYEQGGKLGIPAELGLIEQKGHGDNSPSIKQYFLTSKITGINGDISGQAIRCQFRAPQDGYLVVKVGYGGQTSGSSAQSIEKHFMGMMRRTSIAPESSARLTYQSMGDDTVTLTHSGADGVFFVDVVPLAALAGRWGLSIEVTFFRALEAPMLQSVTVI